MLKEDVVSIRIYVNNIDHWKGLPDIQSIVQKTSMWINKVFELFLEDFKADTDPPEKNPVNNNNIEREIDIFGMVECWPISLNPARLTSQGFGVKKGYNEQKDPSVPLSVIPF